MSNPLTARQSALLSLCDDLNAQGWDQKPKIWFVKGDVADEWFVFAHEFSGAPEDHLLDLITDNALPEDAHGVLVVSEGWTYPQRVLDTFKTESALGSYARVTPPSEHPDRVELRHMLLVCDDGEVWALTYTNQKIPTCSWAHVDTIDTAPIGDRTVDAARGLVGLNDPLVQRLTIVDGMQALSTIAAVIEDSMVGNLNEAETTRNLFLSLPEAMRTRLVQDMPEDIKEIVRKVLTEDERRKYGL